MVGGSNLRLTSESTMVSGLSGVDYRPLSKIQEMKESSRPSTQGNLGLSRPSTQGNLASLAVTTADPKVTYWILHYK